MLSCTLAGEIAAFRFFLAANDHVQYRDRYPNMRFDDHLFVMVADLRKVEARPTSGAPMESWSRVGSAAKAHAQRETAFDLGQSDRTIRMPAIYHSGYCDSYVTLVRMHLDMSKNLIRRDLTPNNYPPTCSLPATHVFTFLREFNGVTAL